MRVLSASPPFRFRELRLRVTRMFAARLGRAPMAALLCLAATCLCVASACLTLLHPSIWPMIYRNSNRVTAWGRWPDSRSRTDGESPL